MEDVGSPDVTLKPPSVDCSTTQGKQNRRKLLRAWVELSCWISDFKRVNCKQLTIDLGLPNLFGEQHGISQSGRSTNCTCNWTMHEKCIKLPLVPIPIKVSIYVKGFSSLISFSSQRRTDSHDCKPGSRRVVENAGINADNVFTWFVRML